MHRPSGIRLRGRPRAAATIAVAALTVAIAGCSGSEPRADSGTASTSVATEPGVESAPDGAAVPAALEFSAPLVGGGEFDGADYAGRPVVFWFWAPT